jgi:hypothetical protein
VKKTAKNPPRAGAGKRAAGRSPVRTATRRSAGAARQAAPAPAKAAPVPAAPAAPVRLARVAKGKKPQYFSDPAIDKLLWMTLTLMEELSVTRDRLDAVENLLEGRRVLKVADVDAYRPSGASARRRQAQRAAYVDRMMRAAQAELEELTGRDMPRSDAEVVAAVEA